MISGIEVLAQNEILYTPLWASALLLIGLFMMIGFGAATIFYNKNLWGEESIKPYDKNLWGEESIKPLVRSMLLFFLSIIIGYIGSENSNLHTESYTYDVTITDETKLADFLEQYEIIDEKEDVYTIKEKNLNLKESHELWKQHNTP